MINKVRSHSLGKLEIYIEPSHKVQNDGKNIFRKLFPKSVYMHIIEQAKKDGIVNASAHSTHSSYTNNGEIVSFSLEGNNSKLAMCVELVDKREKLEEFFLRHKNSLHSRVVIFKEVEVWDID